MRVNRREFLSVGAGATLAATLGRDLAFAAASAPAVEPGTFDFVFFTDTHIQPELNAGAGCEMCFRKIAGIKSDFAVMGGDHVFDALAVDNNRAKLIFDLYQKTQQSLPMKLYHTIGNHDLFGINTLSGIEPNDPGYGKKLYEDRFGQKTYYSFDHQGYHFFVLDSVQPTADRMWDARIDDEQFAWLAADLKQVAPPSVPIIGITHVPLVTAFPNYDDTLRAQKYSTLSVGNSAQVLKLFEDHNVVAVLQGHTHINEVVSYKNTQYITSGAVCGNWWKGLRMGFPEGFTVVSLNRGKISTRYETYGFKSVAAIGS
jgi:3',5'-cyclic-AMP phosphodiesterase